MDVVNNKSDSVAKSNTGTVRLNEWFWGRVQVEAEEVSEKRSSNRSLLAPAE